MRELVARFHQFAGLGEKFQRVLRIRGVREIHLVGELGGGNIAGFVQEGRGGRSTPDLWGEGSHDSYRMGGGLFGGRGR